MPTPTSLPAWQKLLDCRQEMEGVHMRALFTEDPGRFDRFSPCWPTPP